jgi:hypothetical protein
MRHSNHLQLAHDTLALVPQHLLRLILPNVFDLASSVHTDGVLCRFDVYREELAFR